MAVRLPVILSQPARRDASTTDLVENTVAAALLIPGLDANLIGDIGTLEPGSTDYVCLLGHTRDLVLASFLELAAARAAWQRLEQRGHFIDLAQEEADIRASLGGANAERKVFYFQLALGQPVDRLLDRCRKLLSAQQLSLVSIQWRPTGGNGASSGSSLPEATGKPLLAPIASSSSLPLARSAGSPAQAGGPERSTLSEQRPAGQVVRGLHGDEDEREEWSALDKLVDDLDAMDL